MGKDELIVLNGDYTIRSCTNGGDLLQNIICLYGTLSMESHSTILNHATVVGNVSMENLTFIYELHMLAPGEIFFRGNNHIILNLYAPFPIVVHVPKGHSWKEFIYNCYGGQKPIEVREDIIAD